MCNLDDPKSPVDDPDLGLKLILDHRLIGSMPEINGKSVNRDTSEKRNEYDMLWSDVEAQAALLSSSIWDTKNIPYDITIKYSDLDEFLYDSGIPLESQIALGGASIPVQQMKQESLNLTSFLALPTEHINGLTTEEDQSSVHSEPSTPVFHHPPSPADSTLSFASSSIDFDPRLHPLSSSEELKPQTAVKQLRKQVRHPCSPTSEEFVPDGLKDEKYWARRKKNNMAAKRSRDARRMKENQVALKAAFLEEENKSLRQEMDRLERENVSLRERLSKFTVC